MKMSSAQKIIANTAKTPARSAMAGLLSAAAPVKVAYGALVPVGTLPPDGADPEADTAPELYLE